MSQKAAFAALRKRPVPTRGDPGHSNSSVNLLARLRWDNRFTDLFAADLSDDRNSWLREILGKFSQFLENGPDEDTPLIFLSFSENGGVR